MHLKKRLAVLASTVATVLVLAACGGSQPDLLETHGLDGLTGQQIVERLEASGDARPLAFGASVREREVLLADADTEVAVPLPDDLHYVSVAPFVTSTHECYYHNLATCQGELVEQPVHVTITDESGAVLVDEETTTHVNGFVGFWLPRDMSGTFEVSIDGHSGSVPFSTADGDPTCLTTLRLV